MLAERKPSPGPGEVGDTLDAIANDLGPSGRDRAFGSGPAYADAALKAVAARTADSVSARRRRAVGLAPL